MYIKIKNRCTTRMMLLAVDIAVLPIICYICIIYTIM